MVKNRVIRLLDKEVIQYTRNGIVKKNLATGEFHLVAESDYARELKHNQPRLESRYQSPFNHPERHGSQKDSGTKLNLHLGHGSTKRLYHASFEHRGSNGPQQESVTDLNPVFTQKTSSKTQQYRNMHVAATWPKFTSLGHAGGIVPVHQQSQSLFNSKPNFYQYSPSQRNATHSVIRAQDKKSNLFSLRLQLFNMLQKRLGDSLSDSEKDEDENLGTQTIGTVYRTAGNIRFGVNSVAELKKRLCRKRAKESVEKTVKRGTRFSAKVSSAVKVEKGIGKTSSILKHPALIKFALIVAAIFGAMILLSALLGGTTGSFIGSATEHPELTSYVQQLDTDFLNKINSAIASYSQNGYVVTVEGDANISTDSGSLAILATQDWVDGDLTSAYQAKLAQCHAVLNYYTCSFYDEIVGDGKSRQVIHHVIVLIHACTAEERIDAFGFSPGVKAHVLEMLGIFRQIESETGSEMVGGGNVSATVLAYQALINRYCNQYGIPGYTNLVLAVMQQESGGTGKDPMQASECGFNTRFSHSPNSITDPAYSIQCGVEDLASCLRAAKCKSPSDISNISLALQGYNYGNGYISWAQQRGGYSQANAIIFSQMEAKKAGTSGYGDVNYVNHVLKYYNAIQNGGNFIWPVTGHTDISSGYGPRIDPITGEKGAFHQGIDIPAPTGTPIHAAASGTVIYAQFGSAPYGGYGNLVIIRHSSSLVTMYAHCSKLLVTVGQTVQQGQGIALVGSTGKATGAHCHFEIRINGVHTNPLPYLQSKAGK